MLEDVSVIFFDCGNTLWSDIAAKKLMVNSILTFLNISSFEEFEDFYCESEVARGSSPFYSAIEKLKKRNVPLSLIKENIDNLFKKMSFKEYVRLHPLNEGVKECLELLCEKKKLGIIANQHSIAKDLLNYYDLSKYFDYIFLSCDYKIKKPDEKLFKIACRKLDVLPKNSVMVGDSYYNDIVPAKKIGMKTILISNSAINKIEIDYRYSNMSKFFYEIEGEQ